MTAHRDRRDDLAAERATNEAYLRLCDEATARTARTAGAVAAPANTIWGGRQAAPSGTGRAFGPLIGRVALDSGDGELTDFYVAPRHVDYDRALFVSWAAPLAGLFFDGPDWDPARVPDRAFAPDPRSLLARRSFAARGDDIAAFADDLEPDTDRSSVFRRDAEPATILPPPPATSPTTPPTAGREPPREPPPPTNVDAPEPEDGEPQDEPDTRGRGMGSPGPTAGPPATSRPAGRLERADRLVRKAIEGPRGTRLHSILRTLQPDQHRYVTWLAGKHLAVQGHPGTGKTIVATHRAAFLTHAESPDRLKRVALVGPTDEWATHVFGVLDETGAEGVEVISIETLVRGLAEGRLARGKPAGRSTQPLHRENEREFQTNWELGRIAERAANDLGEQLSRESNPGKRMQMVTRRIIEACNTGDRLADGLSQECRDWLSSARSFDHARTDASYLLFLACVGMAVAPRSEKCLYENLIVDEVQDLRPAEWKLLSGLLRPEGRWSLFGDMNQRRADVTWDSWESLLTNLDLGPGDGTVLEHEILTTGYRSNDVILRYANWLLPQNQRSHRTLRGGAGDAVRVRRVRPAELFATAEEEARRLAEEFNDGVVAVIVWSQDNADRMRNYALEWGVATRSGAGKPDDVQAPRASRIGR